MHCNFIRQLRDIAELSLCRWNLHAAFLALCSRVGATIYLRDILRSSERKSCPVLKIRAVKGEVGHWEVNPVLCRLVTWYMIIDTTVIQPVDEEVRCVRSGHVCTCSYNAARSSGQGSAAFFLVFI